ncbi:hypothetical protein HH310_02330 [Actinoplanes sp. TBRC 11911]|uniref:VOC family protein n=1 Tax=Actinoplanes sp. TBRC 11911 TaxID=2729386 RepID=UPI00145E667D|nr:hypothetical protein [Actinoplanes sp. TBRC 11911]NMO50033.1 hypothetical protein [Actinoplanes sp. TBRC 11911]
MQILRTLVRIVVDSLDDSLPLFEDLTDTTGIRFPYREWQIGIAQDFLLVQIPAGTGPAWVIQALCVVDELSETLQTLTDGGAEILRGPTDVPSGRNIIARHSDGMVIEYLLPNADMAKLLQTAG